MWWKIYFWIVTISASIFILVALSKFDKANLMDVIAVTVLLIQLLGLYAYVFKKFILTPQIWKYFFWFWIILTMLQLIQVFSPNPILDFMNGGGITELTVTSKGGLIINHLLNLPVFYAVYRLSTGTNKKSC